MSEKSIAELIGILRQQSPGTAQHYACVAMIDARIARAEAAEAYANWMIDDADPLSISLKKHCEGERLCRAYGAAREAVRKLEDEQ